MKTRSTAPASSAKQKFLIGCALSTGSVSVTEAGFAYTRLAETLIARLFARVCEEISPKRMQRSMAARARSSPWARSADAR